jgi:phosphatidylserine decarboxylase
MRWLSECHFFRDPIRPLFGDASYFFAPADGVVLYRKVVAPDEAVVDVKGVAYSLRDALREPSFDRPSLVIGIFMTFYDVHVNRIPLGGRLSYRDIDCILPFERKQGRHFAQNQRFSQIRYGSQVDLVVPLSPSFELSPLVEVGVHVEAGVDRLIRIARR